MFETLLNNAGLKALADRARPGCVVKAAGVWGASAALVAAGVARLAGRPLLLVTGHLDRADELADDLEVLTARPAGLLPAWEVDSVSDHLSGEVGAERLRVCRMLSEGDQAGAEVFVAPVMALLQPVPTAGAISEARRLLRVGEECGPDGLSAWLTDAGYEHVEQVEGQGEYARRGGIVDLFPQGPGHPMRVEFFGDVIESIRRFDLDTQRSTERIESCDLVTMQISREMQPGQTTCFLDYLPAGAIVCVIEPGEVRELAQEFVRRLTEDREQAAAGAAMIGAEELFERIERLARVEMYTFAPSDPSTVVDLGITSVQRLEGDTHAALTELARLAGESAVWVYCETPAERERFQEVLAAQHPELAGQVHLGIGHVNGGFCWPAERLVVVGHHEIYHRYSKVRRIRRVRAGRPIDSLLDLAVGDYVVHVAHGIAKFEGLRTLPHDGASEEFLSLRFADNAVMHVPASNINLVQRYVGTGGKRPALSKLGGALWARQKERAAEAVKDMAAEMLRLQAMRNAMPGTEYPVDTDWQKKFADEFLYTETADQLATARQIADDMSISRPMDRLVCGDVGYGKTELAMRAAFCAVEAGRQVAVLVPTTVLAAQHFRTFSERFADYPVKVEMLSRFRTGGQIAEVVRKLVLREVDIVIGTHRLLSKDVKFADLGLAIIDEEQRFGVAHKEHLKTLRASVEVLTLTATPIPRTLHMALLGLRDISSLTTAPLDRRAIHTEVCHYDTGRIAAAIRRELAREGQVFFVHNRVHDIEALADRIRELVPEARVEIGHGQMPQGKLEHVMRRFVLRDIDVLVCTTIIESGLDIPTANTMIIHEADRFGLAELHQLRGRVGRYKHRAFCTLFLPEDRPVSPVAAKRLKAIEEFSDLGAGFQIAMRDLELRGAGNLLGKDQSGHIAAVGYELYCELLAEAVSGMRGEVRPRKRQVHVELGLEAHVPRTYVPAERQRMEIYRRLSRAEAPAELRQLAEDLLDAYGPVPEAVEALLALAEIRLRAGALGIESILREDPDLIFTMGDMAAVRNLFDGAAGTVRMADARTAHWRVPAAYLAPEALARVLTKRLRSVTETL